MPIEIYVNWAVRILINRAIPPMIEMRRVILLSSLDADAKERLGRRLAKLRKESGNTQPSMARLLGVKLGRYKAWERGANPLPSVAIYALCKEFGISSDYFFSDYELSMEEYRTHSGPVDELVLAREEVKMWKRKYVEDVKKASLAMAKAADEIEAATET